MTIYIEIGLLLAAFATAWFVNGVFRMRKLTASGNEYVAKFVEICDDDNIPMRFVDAIHELFRLVTNFSRAIPVYRSIAMRDNAWQSDASTLAQLGGLPPESASRLGEAYFLLLNHISYHVPILGFVMRRFILGGKPRSATSDEGAKLISAVGYVSHAV